MIVIYCYLERNNNKVLKFGINNPPSSYFKKSIALKLVLHIEASKKNKRQGYLT